MLAKPETTTDQVPALIKGGRRLLKRARDFMDVLERERAAIGVHTTVHPIQAAEA